MHTNLDSGIQIRVFMELDKNFKKSEFTNPLESGLPKMVLRTRIPQSRFVSIPGIRILMKLADGDTSHATSLRGILNSHCWERQCVCTFQKTFKRVTLPLRPRHRRLRPSMPRRGGRSPGNERNITTSTADAALKEIRQSAIKVYKTNRGCIMEEYIL